MHRILVVEDEPMLAALLTEVLADWGYDVVTAHTASEAVRAAAEHRPEAAVLDVQLGSGPSGFDLSVSLAHAFPDIHIVFLTNVADPRFLGHRSNSLPRGSVFVRKASVSSADDLIRTLRAVFEGRPTPAATDEDSGFAELTTAQIEVLRMVAEGASNRRIAQVRGTSERAVESLLQRAALTLGILAGSDANVRVQLAAAYARATGVLRDA